MSDRTKTFRIGKLHPIEVRARTITEARGKCASAVDASLASANATAYPLTFMHRGYCGVVAARAAPEGGSWSMIVAPDGSRRAFSSSAKDPRREILSVAEHVRSVARDELGPAGAIPALADVTQETDRAQLAGYARSG